MTVDPQELGVVAAGQRVIDGVKPKLRGWLHAVTSPLAVAAGIVLIALANPGKPRVGAAIFAAASITLFTVSAVYHRGNWSELWHTRLKRFDHANIFILIAGSYTPFALLALTGVTRVLVLSLVWAGALAGVFFRVVWVTAPRWLYTPLYILLGWAAAFIVPQLIHGAGVAAFVLVAVGGVLYTAGGLIYALRKPDPFPKWFGFHEVFHSLTIAAFTCQYVAASFVVYRYA